MKRMSLAAAAVLTLGLLAPAATAIAAPTTCGKALIKEHKKNDHRKANGHTKAKFVYSGKAFADAVPATADGPGTLIVTVRGGKNKALRGCEVPVRLTTTTKINRNDASVGAGAIKMGDHVNVKGTSDWDKDSGKLIFKATRVSAEGPVAPTP